MSFENIIEFTLQWEGGYSNNPSDPGGETNFGISKRSYPNLDIKNLTKEEAIEIYKRDYWDKAGCDQYSDELAMSVFDFAVNGGVSRATSMMVPDWKDYLFIRLTYYLGLRKKFPQFVIGWFNRTLELYKFISKVI